MEDMKKLKFKNPVIRAQMLESPFIPDKVLGHTMPSGKDFIGKNQFFDIDSIINEAFETKRKVVLNIGDSSTSGWDSNVITINRELKKEKKQLLSPFFRYETYSDYLRDILNEEFIIINAGVPAHTSLQGYLRLKYLLSAFSNKGVPIELVTIYYGNNDSVWDHNRRDNHWVGKGFFTQKVINFLLFFRKSNDSVITRVSPKNYAKNIRNMVKECQSKKIKVAVIESITPIYWEPGTRVKNEKLERTPYLGSDKIYSLLDESLSLWKKAIDSPYSEAKKALLIEAKEKDFVVPRIKKSHLIELRRLVKKEKIPYLSVEIDRSENDIENFIDYCHPINEANRKIAKKIKEHLLGNSQQEEIISEKREFSCEKRDLDTTRLPTDHYTIY